MRGRRGAIVSAVLATGAAIGALALGGAGAAEPPFGDERVVVLGRSAEGKPIRAVRIGDPSSARKALAVGVIHGDERAGLRITAEIRRSFGDLTGVDLWLVDRINPDGAAARTRGNAHGVDLNRNFPYRWRPGSRDGYYPGPGPLSEPESRAIKELIEDLQPAVSVWYHQPWGAVLRPCKGPAPIQRRYAHIAGERTSCRGANLRGTAISWQNHSFPGTTAFVVELGPGRVSARTVRRHARAAVDAAVGDAGTSPPLRDSARNGPATAAAAGRSARISSGGGARAASEIKDWLIPYGSRRKRQMAAYSKRHYGQAAWRLEAPKLIVEHYSESNTARSVYETFAANRRDPELHELPGVCAHFVISPGGRIYRLVKESIRCRHVIGLNHVSIGIEHVGTSDAQVMNRERQVAASLRLTRELQCRYGIGAARVIGHAESLSSPLYRERVKRARGKTHGDFRHRTMRGYRRELRRLGPC